RYGARVPSYRRGRARSVSRVRAERKLPWRDGPDRQGGTRDGGRHCRGNGGRPPRRRAPSAEHETAGRRCGWALASEVPGWNLRGRPRRDVAVLAVLKAKLRQPV